MIPRCWYSYFGIWGLVLMSVVYHRNKSCLGKYTTEHLSKRSAIQIEHRIATLRPNVQDLWYFLNKLCLSLNIANTLWKSAQLLFIFIWPISNLTKLYKMYLISPWNKVFINENVPEDIACEMMTILSRGDELKGFHRYISSGWLLIYVHGPNFFQLK